MCKKLKDDSTYYYYYWLYFKDNSMIGKFMHFYGWIDLKIVNMYRRLGLIVGLSLSCKKNCYVTNFRFIWNLM